MTSEDKERRAIASSGRSSPPPWDTRRRPWGENQPLSGVADLCGDTKVGCAALLRRSLRVLDIEFVSVRCHLLPFVPSCHGGGAPSLPTVFTDILVGGSGDQLMRGEEVRAPFASIF